MPGNHEDDDDDKGKGKGGTAGGATTRSNVSTTDQLTAAARSITTLRTQLDTILSSWVDPPIPDQPAARSAATIIQNEAGRIVTDANAIMAKFR